MPKAVGAERSYKGVLGTGHSAHCPFCDRVNIATKSPQNPSHFEGLWCTHSNGVTQGAEGPVFVFDTVGVDSCGYKGQYPLHTTGKNYSNLELADQLEKMMNEEDRWAIWVHVQSSKQRKIAHEVLYSKKWSVIGGRLLPDYFVLAVHHTVGPSPRYELIQTIQPSQDEETIDYLAEMFGYAPEDTEWYKDVQPDPHQ